MANAKNHYQLLEVNSATTQAEIKQADRHQAKGFHPDSNPMAAFHEKIARINAAYDVRCARYMRCAHQATCPARSHCASHIARYWETPKNFGLTIDSSVLGQSGKSATQNSISHTDVLCARYPHCLMCSAAVSPGSLMSPGSARRTTRETS